MKPSKKDSDNIAEKAPSDFTFALRRQKTRSDEMELRLRAMNSRKESS